MTHGGADASFNGSGIEPGVDPRYWVIPLGLAVGLLLVLPFKYFTEEWYLTQRNALFTSLSNTLSQKGEELVIDPSVEDKVMQWVDGLSNIFDFWTGGVLRILDSKEYQAQTYEMLALICALLFSVSVAFYTANAGDHLYGLVGCLSNCALWMGTLSSAFFTAVINSCKSDAQVSLLTGLFGKNLMRVPMVLFVWGSLLLFLQFIVFFKLNVDPGLNCSVCLGSCLVFLPLFFHFMHKMGWAAAIVHTKAAVDERKASMLTPADVRASFHSYAASKGDNCLALDRDEFLALLKAPGVQVTSVAENFAMQIFDAHVDAELCKLAAAADCFVATAKPEDVWSSFNSYLSSKEDNCLLLDRVEFLGFLKKPGLRVTSVHQAFAEQIFDTHVEAELLKLGASAHGLKARATQDDVGPELRSGGPSEEDESCLALAGQWQCLRDGTSELAVAEVGELVANQDKLISPVIAKTPQCDTLDDYFAKAFEMKR